MPDIFDKETTPSAKRSDIYLIDPREVTISPEFNGRHELPDIDDLLAEFPTIGQLQPVLVTKDGGAPVLLDGHRRWRAALELTKQKRGAFDGVFKLKCSYFRGSPVECFIATISANVSRKESLPIDDGYNISKLYNFGLSDEEIATRIYRKLTLDGKPDVKWVQDRAALVQLTPEAVEAMKAGRVKPNAAVALAKLSKEAQRKQVKGEAKVTVATIRKATAPANEVKAESNGHRKLNTADFKALIQSEIDGDIETKVEGLTAENAVRTILGELLDKLA